jgi:hypothetical protein
VVFAGAGIEDDSDRHHVAAAAAADRFGEKREDRNNGLFIYLFIYS